MREGIIYLITNTVNGKKYVGQTVQGLSERWSKHRWDAKSFECNSILHAAIRKYGKEAFALEVIAETLEEFLDDLEVFFIKLHASRSHQNGYNLNEGGPGQSGHKPSEEAKAKTRAGNKGITRSPEFCEAARKFHTGRKRSDETRARISAAVTGKKRSPESRARISAAAMGRPCSEETRAKRSQSLKGRIFSDEHRLKLKIAAAKRSAAIAANKETLQIK